VPCRSKQHGGLRLQVNHASERTCRIRWRWCRTHSKPFFFAKAKKVKRCCCWRSLAFSLFSIVFMHNVKKNNNTIIYFFCFVFCSHIEKQNALFSIFFFFFFFFSFRQVALGAKCDHESNRMSCECRLPSKSHLFASSLIDPCGAPNPCAALIGMPTLRKRLQILRPHRDPTRKGFDCIKSTNAPTPNPHATAALRRPLRRQPTTPPATFVVMRSTARRLRSVQTQRLYMRLQRQVHRHRSRERSRARLQSRHQSLRAVQSRHSLLRLPQRQCL
jgi:hypothetical protein